MNGEETLFADKSDRETQGRTARGIDRAVLFVKLKPGRKEIEVARTLGT
jgi:hypothetical protein